MSNTRKLVFSAMGIALAMVTSYIKVWEMPMGGSVTLLSMLFICLIGYWFGPRYGLITGIAYGILQFVVDPYMVSLPQVLLARSGCPASSAIRNTAFRQAMSRACWEGSSSPHCRASSSSPLMPPKA